MHDHWNNLMKLLPAVPQQENVDRKKKEMGEKRASWLLICRCNQVQQLMFFGGSKCSLWSCRCAYWIERDKKKGAFSSLREKREYSTQIAITSQKV